MSTAAARVAEVLPLPSSSRSAHAAFSGVVRGSGAVVWDAEGRLCLDFDNQGGAVVLGHADPDIEAAELNSGDAAEVASRLHTRIACAERVRLTTDTAAAMNAALRIARAETGRRRIIACTGNPVWGATQSIEPHRLSILDGFLDVFGDETAAVVLEPFAFEGLTHASLSRLQTLVKAHGALLIFDETRSGLRLAKGGAQALFGVIPDLAVFGPSLGNGAAIAAIAGHKDLMAQCMAAEPDPRAVAAAAATLRKMQTEPVIATLSIRGAELQAEVEALLPQTGADAMIRMSGDPTWTRFDFTGPRQAAMFRAEALARGIHTDGAHVMSYAHGDDEISALVSAYREILPRLVKACGGQAVI